MPKADFERLLPDLEPVKLALGEVLYRPEEFIKYVYFPNTAMNSVVATTAEGQCAEAGVIGREGMVGVDVLMGADWSLNQNIIQRSGDALRLKASVIKKESNRAARCKI